MIQVASASIAKEIHRGIILSETSNETVIINSGCHKMCPENCPPNNWRAGKRWSSLLDSNIEIQCGNQIFVSLTQPDLNIYHLLVEIKKSFSSVSTGSYQFTPNPMHAAISFSDTINAAISTIGGLFDNITFAVYIYIIFISSNV